MKFITLVVAIAAAFPAAFAQLTINTPASVVECEPTLLTWSGGQEPYYLTFVPSGQPTANPIKSFPTQTGTSLTWNVDLSAGTNFNIALKDSTGAQAYSSQITIQAGSSTSCVNTSVQETVSGASGAASSTGGTAASTTAGSAGSATSAAAIGTAASSSSATSTASGSSSSSTSSSTSGAGRLGVSSAFAFAGLTSLVGAALF